MTDQYTKASPSLHKEISHQLKLILASPDFNATPQQIALLKYVVNQTLAGKSRDIEDETIAADVFSRGPTAYRSHREHTGRPTETGVGAVLRDHRYKRSDSNRHPQRHLCAYVQKAEAKRTLNRGVLTRRMMIRLYVKPNK